MNEDSGFTLLELMVVIGIMAILLAGAVPSFIGRMPAKRLEAAAGEVSAAIQTARLAAVKENTPAQLHLDVNTESYSVRVPGRLVKGGQLPAGVDLRSVFLSSQTTSAPGGLITFDSRGFPTPPVDVVLQNTKGTAWTIEVNLTGSSRIVRD